MIADTLHSGPTSAFIDDCVQRVVTEARSQNPQWGKPASGDANQRELSPLGIASITQRMFPLVDPDALVQITQRSTAEVFGLGPLEPILADPSITEVMINGTGDAWIERSGQLRRISVQINHDQVLQLIERVLAPLGQRIDRLHPMVDARLGDGSRVHAIIPPVAVDGPSLTIRRFARSGIALGCFATPWQESILRGLVRDRHSIVVCGSTGSGKTSLLNALASVIDDGERVITIEDTAELRLPNAHVVRLEARQPTQEGLGEITLRQLVKTSLRMRPDRIIVGEVRGPEALDMVQAMSTGHRGSMSTIHAETIHDALRRLEVMVMMAGVGLDLHTTREQLDMAIDVIIHVERRPDGNRRVTRLSHVSRTSTGEWSLHEIAPTESECESQAKSGSR